MKSMKIHNTTIVAVRREHGVVIAGDGQATLNNTVIKGTSKKVRKMADGTILGGFAGSAADGMTLFERLESKLKEFNNSLPRAAVELAKDWRTDRYLRRLEAMILVADRQRTFLLSGNGDVIEPDEGAVGIGSGGTYAVSAARALLRHTNLSARAVAEQSLLIASELCIYTNNQFTIEELA